MPEQKISMPVRHAVAAFREERIRPEDALGGARLLTDYLGDLEKGRFLIDASRELQELLAAVIDTGKAGTLTLRLSLAPLGGGGEAIQVSGAINSKAPSAARVPTMFFITADGNLSRRDPRQGDLEDHLRTINHGE